MHFLLVGMELVFVLFIRNINKGIKEMSISPKSEKEEFIINFNKRYALPAHYTILILLIIISISLMIFEWEVAINFMRVGFPLIMIIGALFWGFGIKYAAKKLMKFEENESRDHE